MFRVLLTHDRTPPINPRLYPVAKSSFRRPLGLSERPGLWASSDLFLPGQGPRKLPLPVGLVAALRDPPSKLIRAGLEGRLFCQNWRSSLPTSWPVVDQLFRIVSRSSKTWRLMSSSFFFSQDTLSSFRDVPRFSCRAIY